MRLKYLVGMLCLLSAPCWASAQLQVEKAWIRTPPPGATMLAGYAVLHNAGDAPLQVLGASSADFAQVTLHQSISDNGVERMRELPSITLAPGKRMEFAPGGRHFMLMRPTHPIKAGDTVAVHLRTGSGPGVDVNFTVRDDAP